MPSSSRSKQPTSSAGPYRFFTARTSRSRECRSPSNCSTTSTRCSSMRGPAIEPSLVTWPTSSVAMPRALATWMSASATSRTWVTPPGAPSTSALDDRLHRVDDQQRRAPPRRRGRARRRGRSRRRGTAPRSSAPIRSARSRTWAADSSPVTYSARRPLRPACAATSSSSVDLPTPGSPASSTTAPGTRPPPSTRSSSGTPVRARGGGRDVDLADGQRGATDRARPRPGAAAGRRAPTASTVPQAWHSPQRPTHLAAVPAALGAPVRGTAAPLAEPVGRDDEPAP